MYAVHRRTIGCRVRSKIPGMFAMVPATTVILATRYSCVSTRVSYTRSLDLTCLNFFLWWHMKQLVYETIVETEEDHVARITIAAGNIADMPGIFERTYDQWSDDVLRAYRPMEAHSSSSCECHCYWQLKLTDMSSGGVK